MLLCRKMSEKNRETTRDNFSPSLLSCDVRASEPKALLERAHREAGDGQAQMGTGVQRIPGVHGRIHEFAGMLRRVVPPPPQLLPMVWALFRNVF